MKTDLVGTAIKFKGKKTIAAERDYLANCTGTVRAAWVKHGELMVLVEIDTVGALEMVAVSDDWFEVRHYAR